MEKLKPIEISYGTSSFEVEILEAEGKKTAIIKGKLMDDSINKNNWHMATEDLKTVAEQIPGSAIKVQHSQDDWDIVGTGVKGTVKGNTVFYENKITDPKAVAKFESGTWNSQNIGISPRLKFDSIICSVCGKDARVNHEHVMGQKYNENVCKYGGNGAHLVEQSLTSEPAYKPQAGTIDNVAFSASMNKFIEYKKEEDSMSDTAAKDQSAKSQFDAVILNKDHEIEDLKAEVEKGKKKTKELDASKIDLDKKYKELEAKYKESATKVDGFVAEQRKTLLEERLKDKDLIASILENKMTDKEFKAELEMIDKIKASTKTNVGEGTLPAEGTDDRAKLEAKIGEEMFGSGFEAMIGKEEGSK